MDEKKLIFFEKDNADGSGFRVRFLADYLREFAPFVLDDKESGKAFGLCFRMRRNSLSIDQLLDEPVPEIKLVNCPDSKTWRALLQESNKRTPGVSPKQVIFLRNKADLMRLKNAILMKKIISLNAADYILKLKNFTRGRLLRMPTVREEDVELIDADVATCYYHSELYYSVLEESLEADYSALRKVLSGTDYETELLKGR